MGNAYEPERNYDTSLGRFRNFKFKSFETPKYCVKITSGDDAVCRNNPKDSTWDGGAVELDYITKDFDSNVATLNRGEKEVEFCMIIDQVNIEDDIFAFQATSRNGVCITSLTVNNEQLLVGENNEMAYFWMDKNDQECSDKHMSTDILEIQNGRVFYSECKKDKIRRNEIIHSDVTVYETFDIFIMLNLEKNIESGWSNIFGFQKEGIKAFDNGIPIGSRVPAVWLRPNTNALHICMALNGNENSCWNSPEIPVDTWFKLNIRQIFDQNDKQYTYQILIDDEVKRSVTNRQAMKFERVNGILGNSYQPERDYKTVAGQFKDFKFKSFISMPAGFEPGSDVITPGLSCSAGSENERIVGGDKAKKGSWPWLVQLEVDCSDDGLTYDCAGTILSNTRILTAAHCFCGAMTNQTTSDTVRALVGNWNLNNEEEEGEFVVTAKKIIIHPIFGSIEEKGFIQFAYDFAILEIPDLSKVN